MRQASIAGGTMPRLRPFRSAPSQDIHPLGWVVTSDSADPGDAAGAVAVFETAEPVADGGRPIAEFDGFAGAFVFFEETVTAYAPAQILTADSDNSGAGMLDRAAIDWPSKMSAL